MAFNKIAVHLVRQIDECAQMQSQADSTKSIKDMLQSLMMPVDHSLKQSLEFYYEELSIIFTNYLSNPLLVNQCLTISHLNQNFNRVVCLLFYRSKSEASPQLAVCINEGLQDLFKIEAKSQSLVCKPIFDCLITMRLEMDKPYNQDLLAILKRYFFLYATVG